MLASPPERSIGICPALVKNILVAQPLTPVPVKYSILAGNVMRRGTTSGRKIESEKDRWLLAKIAAPLVGMCSAPSTLGRQSTRTMGPTRIILSNQ